MLLLLFGMEFHCKSKRFNMTYIVGPVCFERKKKWPYQDYVSVYQVSHFRFNFDLLRNGNEIYSRYDVVGLWWASYVACCVSLPYTVGDDFYCIFVWKNNKARCFFFLCACIWLFNGWTGNEWNWRRIFITFNRFIRLPRSWQTIWTIR